MKFGRTYRMVVDGQSQQWVVTSPLTCRFHISATGTPTPNKAHFILYNLPEKVRNDISKDIFDGLVKYRQVSFSAGYENEVLPVVFVGNLFWVYSYREGPDWITEIDALDGGFAIETGEVSFTAPAGTSFHQILRTIAQGLPNLKLGSISSRLSTRESARAESVSGNAWEELVRRILPLNAQLFISRETVHIIAQDEYVPNDGGVTEISDDTGIIGSPRRWGALTIARMVFEPRMSVGQKVVLKSSQPYTGDSKVLMVDHSGTISHAVSEGLSTRVSFLRMPTTAQEVR